MHLMWLTKPVQISIHHLWLINVTRSTSSKLALTIFESSTTSYNLHSQPVTQHYKFHSQQPTLTIHDSTTSRRRRRRTLARSRRWPIFSVSSVLQASMRDAAKCPLRINLCALPTRVCTTGSRDSSSASRACTQIKQLTVFTQIQYRTWIFCLKKMGG